MRIADVQKIADSVERLSKRFDARVVRKDVDESWTNDPNVSVNGFSVGQSVKVKSSTGLGKSEGADTTAKIVYVSKKGGLVQVDKRKRVYATHHLEHA